MRNPSLLGALLSLGMALSAHAQAPAGYLTLDAVELEVPPAPAVPGVANPVAQPPATPTVAAVGPPAPLPAVPPNPVTVSPPPGGGQNLASLKSVLSTLFSPPVRPAETTPTASAAPGVAPTPPAAPALVVATEAPPAAAPPGAAFEAKAGDSLRETLVAWSRKAGWSAVEWRLPGGLDFTLEISGFYPGDYMEATRAFIDALGCEAELRVLFNPTTKVTRVETL